MAEPTDRDWVELEDAIANMQWTERRLRAGVQEAEAVLRAAKWWRGPVRYARLAWTVWRLRRQWDF